MLKFRGEEMDNGLHILRMCHTGRYANDIGLNSSPWHPNVPYFWFADKQPAEGREHLREELFQGVHVGRRRPHRGRPYARSHDVPHGYGLWTGEAVVSSRRALQGWGVAIFAGLAAFVKVFARLSTIFSLNTWQDGRGHACVC